MIKCQILTLGNDILYETSYEGNLTDFNENDIFKKYTDEDKNTELIDRKRFFDLDFIKIKLLQYSHKWTFNANFNQLIVIPENVTHLTFGKPFSK